MSSISPHRNRVALFFALLIAGTATIVVLSLIRSPGRLYFFANQDKVGHFLAYLALAWLAARAFAVFSSRRFFLLLFAFFYAGFTGATLEVLQPLLTSTRQGDWLDLVANLAGALSGCALFCLIPGFSSSHDPDRPLH